MEDTKLIKAAFLRWIDNHSEEKKDAPYMINAANGEAYTLNNILSEVDTETEFGKKVVGNIVTLCIDLLTRGKKNLQ